LFTEDITVGSGTAAPPFFDPPPGSYFGNVGVTLRSTTRLGSPLIRYTLDGTDPLDSPSAIVYNNIFYIGTHHHHTTRFSSIFFFLFAGPDTVTVRARTFATGLTTSSLTEGEYTFGNLDTTGLVGYWSFDRIALNLAQV
jgi:hypothetical protein